MRSIFHNNPSTESELAKVIQQAGEDDVINEETEDMIRGVFDISKRRIGDIMIPRTRIATIDLHSTISEAIAVITAKGHSRYPVTINNKDHVRGILMAKDLLPIANQGDKKLEDFPHLLHEPVIVPESKKVNMMLKDFQKDRFHMAVVVDEYGGVCGVVTIEDILELIVGEISDEYDVEVPEAADIVKTGDNTYVLNGTTPIEDFCEYFGIQRLPAIDVDTVAGLVIHFLGHLPKGDESVLVMGNLAFKITELKQRQVVKLQLTLPADYPMPEHEEDKKQ